VRPFSSVKLKLREVTPDRRYDTGCIQQSAWLRKGSNRSGVLEIQVCIVEAIS
jgi:hypothetical protein